VKNLYEDDVRYLAQSQFADWKNFVMMRHLRVELEIEKHLYKITEAETRDEGEDDLNDRVAEDVRPQTITEEERQKILVTRSRLTAWFGS
jgi:hypothetical protein